MKLNLRETHSINISRSRTPHLPHPHLILCGIDIEVFNSFKFLGVTVHDKLTKLLLLLPKKLVLFGNNDAVLKSFYAFILPCF